MQPIARRALLGFAFVCAMHPSPSHAERVCTTAQVDTVEADLRRIQPSQVSQREAIAGGSTDAAFAVTLRLDGEPPRRAVEKVLYSVTRKSSEVDSADGKFARTFLLTHVLAGKVGLGPAVLGYQIRTVQRGSWLKGRTTTFEAVVYTEAIPKDQFLAEVFIASSGLPWASQSLPTHVADARRMLRPGSPLKAAFEAMSETDYYELKDDLARVTGPHPDPTATNLYLRFATRDGRRRLVAGGIDWSPSVIAPSLVPAIRTIEQLSR